MNVNIINLAYLVASVLFIFGIKGLTSPKKAVRGNLYSAWPCSSPWSPPCSTRTC